MKTTDATIRCDGKGYYDYLPAVFIYKDLNFGFRNTPVQYAEDNRSHNIVCNGKIINKYTCGLAVLWAPFFAAAHVGVKTLGHSSADGFSLPYHYAVEVAALVYLFIGLIYLRKLLELYSTRRVLISAVQIIFLFSTNLYVYAYFDPSFGHLYSFALISVFCYSWIKWIKTNQSKYVYALSLVLGLIVLIRPFNLLMVLFLPFLSGGIKPFYTHLQTVYKNGLKPLLLSAVLFLVVASIQPVMWFVQCGNFFPWTYTQETFLFSQPALIETLFSFKKGLFIYTPVLLLCLGAFVTLIMRGRKQEAFVLFTALFVLHYFIASWQMWWYGGSLGLRPYVDFYAVLAIMLLLFLQEAKSWGRMLTGVFVLACTGLNLIQTYQYTHYILPAAEMDWEGYKEIFLKTDERYVGMLTYRSYSKQIRTYPVMVTHTPPLNANMFEPGEWREIGLQQIKIENQKQVRLNAIITLDCSQPLGEKLYLSVEDALRNSIYYEEIPLVRITGNKTGMQTIDFSVEFNASKSADATVRVGFYRLKHSRRVERLIIQELGGKH